MPAPVGYNCINFRGSSGGSGGLITDAASDIYCLGELRTTNDAVPRVVPGLNLSFGFTVSKTSTAGDKSGTTDPHFAGYVANTGGSLFQVVGFVPGRTYNLKGLFGRRNAGSTLTTGYQLFDNLDASGTAVLQYSQVVEDGHFMGIDGTEYNTAADWTAADGGNALTFTPTGTGVCFKAFATNGAQHMVLAFQDPTAGVVAKKNLLLLGAGL